MLRCIVGDLREENFNRMTRDQIFNHLLFMRQFHTRKAIHLLMRKCKWYTWKYQVWYRSRNSNLKKSWKNVGPNMERFFFFWNFSKSACLIYFKKFSEYAAIGHTKKYSIRANFEKNTIFRIINYSLKIYVSE